jgi:hypothetical protein
MRLIFALALLLALAQAQLVNNQTDSIYLLYTDITSGGVYSVLLTEYS